MVGQPFTPSAAYFASWLGPIKPGYAGSKGDGSYELAMGHWWINISGGCDAEPECREKMGRPAEAIEAGRLIMERFPTNPSLRSTCRLSVARSHAELGDWAQADSQFRAAIGEASTARLYWVAMLASANLYHFHLQHGSSGSAGDVEREQAGVLHTHGKTLRQMSGLRASELPEFQEVMSPFGVDLDAVLAIPGTDDSPSESTE